MDCNDRRQDILYAVEGLTLWAKIQIQKDPKVSTSLSSKLKKREGKFFLIVAVHCLLCPAEKKVAFIIKDSYLLAWVEDKILPPSLIAFMNVSIY